MIKERKYVTVITPDCPYCFASDTLVVDEQSYNAWIAGTLIQDAFPGMPVNRAEQLVSGFHPRCWNAAFGAEE